MITKADIYDNIESNVNKVGRPVHCTSIFENIGASFPSAYIAEVSHYTPKGNVQLNFANTHQDVTWEVQVFSAKEDGAMNEAYSILNDAENAFRNLGFIEVSCNVIPNLSNTIFRLSARFSRVIANNDTI